MSCRSGSFRSLGLAKRGQEGMNGYYTAAATGVFQGHKQGFWKQLGNRAESRSYRFCGLAVCVCGGGWYCAKLAAVNSSPSGCHPPEAEKPGGDLVNPQEPHSCYPQRAGHCTSLLTHMRGFFGLGSSCVCYHTQQHKGVFFLSKALWGTGMPGPHTTGVRPLSRLSDSLQQVLLQPPLGR